MHKKAARLGWIAPILMGLAAALACAGQPEATATPLPRPTQRPNATATTAPATDQPAATKAPPTRVPAKATATQPSAQPTDAPAESSTGNAPFKLSRTPYTHKTGAFTITLPDGWKVNDDDKSVYAISPDSVASLYFSFTNVGTTFDAATMNTYIVAEETNWFGTFNDYQAKPNEVLKDGTILVHKTLSLSDGTPVTVFSYYWQDGNVVYEQDFWVDTSSYDRYVDALVQVANTTQTDHTAGETANAYSEVYIYSRNNLYQFKVPYAWTHTSAIADITDTETFSSPDNLSAITNIQFDNGSKYTPADADAFAVSLIKQNYNLTDLKIADKQQQSDGSTLLTWTSASQGIDGESDYQARNTTFLLLTWVVDSKQVDFFKPVWSTLLDSYAIPQP